MQHGKTIRIFWVDGSPDGIVTGELSNWNGTIIKLPREQVSTSKRFELSGPGIYFLFCTDAEDGEDSCYIGESECLQDRLNQHIQDFNSGKEKYYWQTVVAVSGNELNKTLVRYLENRAVEIAKDSKRFKILTKNTYKEVVIKEYDRASMEEFIDNTKTLLTALNYRILEPLQQKDSSESENLLYLRTAKAYGCGYLTSDNRFVIKSGSKLNDTPAQKCPTSSLKVRNQYIEDGKVKNWETTEDLLFKSSSQAAEFLTGCSTSGPEHWKDKNGTSLKNL